MKIKVNKDKFLNAVSLAEKATGKNMALPVLGCILLSTKKDGVSVCATNLDLGIEIYVPARVEEEGAAAVPGNVLYGAISNIYSDNDLVLELKNGNILVLTKNGKTLIKTQPHNDFPTLPTVQKPTTLTLNTNNLLKGIRSVWYSASVSTIKPELSSVYLYHKDGAVVFVATDSFRLAEKIVVSQGKYVEFPPILIPLRNIPELIRVLEWGGENIAAEVEVSENQVSLNFNNVYLTSRLIDGTFPDYKQIIPKEHETEVVVLKQDLVNVLKKTVIFSDKFNQVGFRVNPSKKQFMLVAQNQDVGETSESLPAALSGSSIDINFNHKYVSDCLSSINSDSVSLTLSGASKPMVLRGVSDNSFLYLVMPMNR